MLEQMLKTAVMEESLIAGQEFSDEIVTDQIVGRVELDTVVFHRCRLSKCDFSGASFCNVTFDNCDFSNCTFSDNYWKNTNVRECKA